MASPLPQDGNMGILEIPDKKREFEEMVTGRGVEFRRKLEKKRKMDVQLIKLKQYLILIPLPEPFPIGTFTHLQNNQIWETVLEYVTNPLDMDSCKRTCPIFRDILFGKIPTATPDERQVSTVRSVLETVLKIMKKEKYQESTRNPNSWHPRNLGQWHLRLVSKSWQTATDQAFFTEFEGEWHLEVDNGKWWKDDINVTKLRHVNLYAQFVLENSNARSALLQILSVGEGCMTEMGFFYPKILEFLDDYGESVKGLIADWCERTISVGSKYLNLLSLVMRMPNLKALTIDVRPFYDRPSEEDLKTLKNLILRHGFPSYLSLEVLSIQGSYTTNEALVVVVTEILSKSCSNLKSVGLPSWMLENECVTQALIGRDIQFIDCPYIDPRNETLLSLSLLPLRKLVVRNCGNLPYSRLFCSLNFFGNTLECLELNGIDPKFIGGLVSLQLPQLKKLILQSWPGLTNLDFLIPLSGLEYLKFNYNPYFKECKNPEDKFHLIEIGDVEELEQSNIWTCFPHLREADVIVYEDMYNANDEKYAFRLRSTYQYVRKGKEITNEVEFYSLNHRDSNTTSDDDDEELSYHNFMEDYLTSL